MKRIGTFIGKMEDDVLKLVSLKTLNHSILVFPNIPLLISLNISSSKKFCCIFYWRNTMTFYVVSDMGANVSTNLNRLMC